MTTTATKRRCAGKTCLTLLSSYNDDPDGLCGPCRKTQTDAWIKRLREQMDAQDVAPPPNFEVDDHVVADEAKPTKTMSRNVKYAEKELIDALRDLARTVGRTPTSEMVKESTPSYSTYVNHFGSWPAAVSAAGLKPVGGHNAGKVLVSPARRALLEILEEAKDVNTMAAILDRNPESVRSMISVAYARGLVDRYSVPKVGLSGPTVVYYITQAGREALS